MELVPPPAFSQQAVPFPWYFESRVKRDQQNPNEPVTSASTLSRKHRRADIAKIGEHEPAPTGPPSAAPPEESLDQDTKSFIARVRKILAERPVATRRVLSNLLGVDYKHIKVAVAYCGYCFEHGPWHDTIVRFGVDPRIDPHHRIYQTMVFKLNVPGEKETVARLTFEERRERFSHTHIFDGTEVPLASRTFQICDITDQLLRDLLECEPALPASVVSRNSPAYI